VARRANVVEVVGHMVRVANAGVVAFVAGHAIRRCAGVPVRVAGNTVNGQVCTHERETGLVVIEIGRLPGRGVVARGARVAEVVRDMIGIRCAVEVRLMTSIALHRSACVSGAVAINAQGRGMRAGESEAGLAVVECRRGPGVHPVADRAIMLEIIGHMVRVADTDVVAFVTCDAVRGCARVTVSMARNTIDREMRPLEREVCLVMIEVRGLPGIGVVTSVASMTEIVGDMVGIGRAIEIRLVTGEARQRRARVSTAVAIDAHGRRVSTCQHEACLIVIKCRRAPAVHAVTRHAVVIEVVGCMVRIVDAAVVALVAGKAIHRRSVVPCRMTLTAGDREMSAD